MNDMITAENRDDWTELMTLWQRHAPDEQHIIEVLAAMPLEAQASAKQIIRKIGASISQVGAIADDQGAERFRVRIAEPGERIRFRPET